MAKLMNYFSRTTLPSTGTLEIIFLHEFWRGQRPTVAMIKLVFTFAVFTINKIAIQIGKHNN